MLKSKIVYIIFLIISVIIYFFIYKKYNINKFKIILNVVLNAVSIVLVTIDRKRKSILDFFLETERECKDTEWAIIVHLKNISFAFIFIPFFMALIYCCLIYNKKIIGNHLYNIQELISPFLKCFIYIWFKLLINAQAILIGLISLDYIQIKYNKKYLQKFVYCYHDYEEKLKQTNNILKKVFFNFMKYKIVWQQWFWLTIIYVAIAFSFGDKIIP